MSKLWRLQLLGGFSAQRPGQRPRRFQTRKAGAMLAYLAYYYRQRHPREELTERIWATADPVAGGKCMRTALCSLRSELEPDDETRGTVFVSGHGLLGINSDNITTDVREFTDVVQAAQNMELGDDQLRLLTRAVELYRGELLPGYYEDWVLVERERLALMYVSVLRKLVAALEARGERDRALEYALRAVATAPDREEAHYDVIRLYGAMGRRMEALRQYGKLARFLKREMGMRPSAATRSLIAQIRETGRTRGARGRQRTAVAPAKPAPAGQEAEAPQLPSKLSRFFGRDQELNTLLDLLRPVEGTSRRGAKASRDRERLVTLMGPGGSGKTRLAIEGAHRLLKPYNGSVYFAALSDTVDAAGVIMMLVDALGLSRPAGESTLDHVVTALQARPSLLITDNFEQLVEGGAELLRELLQRVPSLTLLVTSRRALGLEGETAIQVNPLPVPNLPGTPERLLEFACVQMFADRAQRVCPDFQITSRNAHAIAAVCQRLEGIPLAIELAAARAHVLTPVQMLTQLAARFDFLVTKHQTVETRHRALRNAIEWSYDLLQEDLQRFFARLSVFRGGWSLEAAQTVCDEKQTLEFLDALVQRSLVSAEEAGDQMRFRMLETLREYAVERLTQAERQELERRHAAYFVNLAESGAQALRGPEAQDWLERLDADNENIRAAMYASTAAEHAGLRIAGAMWRFWFLRGYGIEAREWLEAALERDSLAPPELRARVLNGIASLAEHQGDYPEAMQALRESWTLARREDDDSALAETLNNLALLADARQKDRRARHYNEQSLEINRRIGDKWGEAATLNNLARLDQKEADFESAVARYRESQRIYRELHDTADAAAVLNNLGSAAADGGDLISARLAYEESLKLFREVGSRPATAVVLHNLGDVMLQQGDHGDARAYLSESLAIRRDLGDRGGCIQTLESLSGVARSQRDFIRAAVLLGAAESLRRTLGKPASGAERDALLRAGDLLRDALGIDEYRSATDHGRIMGLERAIEYALEPPPPVELHDYSDEFSGALPLRKRRSARRAKIKTRA